MPGINPENPTGQENADDIGFQDALANLLTSQGMIEYINPYINNANPLEVFLTKKLADLHGIDPFDVTPELLSQWEQEVEFDSRPPGYPGDSSGFLTRREILERRIHVEELCGIDTAETKTELARRAIGTYRQ